MIRTVTLCAKIQSLAVESKARVKSSSEIIYRRRTSQFQLQAPEDLRSWHENKNTGQISKRVTGESGSLIDVL